ncbi:EamA family transporter [Celerinatantimonas diazotrophica]|uniref:Carboxylate/amino acid/amine transporter n=1 Tax=Celerinatantimonas diazotrophica TaxID=412034 RepID=A0A4R1J967_9GAMM|nr:EamA family transporter [Celerinatantimonas diazotrophica]TCK46629.1 carboxylate/amino acid/amine transporter [Celerinatantimonas diazotrophica]CAG9295331.1 Biotin transporter [Celerinatantimonas diazotrophica]
MPLLLLVTAVWAFSFSLIGVYLSGQVDAWFSVWIRIALATLVFLPFLRLKNVSFQLAVKLMLIGAIQLGVMYGFYYQSFLYLSVPAVLLFTVLTPMYVTLFNDLMDKHLNRQFFITAFLATIGAIAIRYQHIDGNFIRGLLMVQGANISFALGQVAYKRLVEKQVAHIPQKSFFGWFFIGALITASIGYLLWGHSDKLPHTTEQWSILIYLGVIASGWGYFAFNKGATQVNVGALAIINNLLIPAGILVNLVIWNHNADILRLSIGGIIIVMALIVNQRLSKRFARA